MIPGKFDYHRPNSVSEAIALLQKLGQDARPLAGAQSYSFNENPISIA